MVTRRRWYVALIVETGPEETPDEIEAREAMLNVLRNSEGFAIQKVSILDCKLFETSEIQ